ncbi:MAG: DUF6691 family protein [Gammaproteobacteria bacterium]|nr:DUF6691 family protein [Gammaproteobacteria bacterium]
MRHALAAALAGVLFGYGLSLSRMVDRHVVLGFLDVTGSWDPTLVFVLAGAVGVALVGYRVALRRARPVLAESFKVPTRRSVDVPLLLGAAVFGVGWGLAGYCPGPGIAASALGVANALVFLVSMLAGMMLYHLAGTVRRSREAAIATDG